MTDPDTANVQPEVVLVASVRPVSSANWPEAWADFSRTRHGWLVRVLELSTAAADAGWLLVAAFSVLPLAVVQSAKLAVAARRR
jgi:hypothetical protein